jgi:Leucine-rich repeat (LRR) protein
MADTVYRFWAAIKGKKEVLAEVKSRIQYLLSLDHKQDAYGNDQWFELDDEGEEIFVELGGEYEEDTYKYLCELGIKDRDSLYFLDEGTLFSVDDETIHKDPDALFFSISRAFPKASFLFQVQTDQDNGYGCGMYIYEDGEITKERQYDYTHLEPSISSAVADIRLRQFEAFKETWLAGEHSAPSNAAFEAEEYANLAEMVAEKCSDLPYADGALDLSGNCNDDDELEAVCIALKNNIFDSYSAGAYFSPEKITEINLSGNDELFTLPESICAFPNLTKLIVSGTEITEIPDALLEREKNGALEIIR